MLIRWPISLETDGVRGDMDLMTVSASKRTRHLLRLGWERRELEGIAEAIEARRMLGVGY